MGQVLRPATGSIASSPPNPRRRVLRRREPPRPLEREVSRRRRVRIHPHIRQFRCRRIGELTNRESPILRYLVMEYLEGQTSRNASCADRSDARCAAWIAIELPARSTTRIGAALIHRDLKPAT